jgi:hypothetical protein
MSCVNIPPLSRFDGGFVTVGGKDEAEIYREDYLAVWRGADALEWAKQMTRGLLRKRRG